MWMRLKNRIGRTSSLATFFQVSMPGDPLEEVAFAVVLAGRVAVMMFVDYCLFD